MIYFCIMNKSFKQQSTSSKKVINILNCRKSTIKQTSDCTFRIWVDFFLFFSFKFFLFGKSRQKKNYTKTRTMLSRSIRPHENTYTQN